jgi:hypothetical protein
MKMPMNVKMAASSGGGDVEVTAHAARRLQGDQPDLHQQRQADAGRQPPHPTVASADEGEQPEEGGGVDGGRDHELERLEPAVDAANDLRVQEGRGDDYRNQRQVDQDGQRQQPVELPGATDERAWVGERCGGYSRVHGRNPFEEK